MNSSSGSGEELSNVASCLNSARCIQKESNDYIEQEETLNGRDKERPSIGKVIESAFSANLNFRLGIEGPLPSPNETPIICRSQQASSLESRESRHSQSRENAAQDAVHESSDHNVAGEEISDPLEQGDVKPKDPLMHGIIYPEIELLPHSPMPLDYFKTWSDEENEDWAMLSSKVREEIKGTLTFLHLKRGLSKFSYEIYGFTELDLSAKSLTDISLLARVPMNFNALTHIDVSHNKLTDISALSGLTTVTHLDASHNKLKTLLFMYPEWYWNVDEPEKLSIKENVSRGVSQLSSSGWVLYGVGISQLRWVNYSHNLVRCLGGPKHWSHYPFLSYLDLSHNHISDLRSQDRVTISGESTAHPEGGDGCGGDGSTQCGLAVLAFLHTLNISNNFITRVEGLNGLSVHSLILSNNAITNWEGEAGQLYEDELYAQILDPVKVGIKLSATNTQLTSSSESVKETALKSIDLTGEGGKEFLSEENTLSLTTSLHEDLLSVSSIPLPTIRMILKKCLDIGEEMKREGEEGNADYKDHTSLSKEYPTPKTVEVLFTEADRKKEKIPLEVLYKSKRQTSKFDPSSEDLSVMDESYLRKSDEGDYTTRRRHLEILHFSDGLRCSEEDCTNNSDSVSTICLENKSSSCEMMNEPTPKVSSEGRSGQAEEVSLDTLSISTMYDYEWQGYQPDDQCFAKGRRKDEVFEERRVSKGPEVAPPGVEVLYARDSGSAEDGRGVESDLCESESILEKVYDEWDDQELRILHTSRLETDSDYDTRSREDSSLGVESRDDVKVLFRAEGGICKEGMRRAGWEGSSDGREDGVEVLFRLSDGHPDALVAAEVSVCKSVEVLYHSTDYLSSDSTGMDTMEGKADSEISGSSSASDRTEVCFEVCEKVESENSEGEDEAVDEEENCEASSSAKTLTESNCTGDSNNIQVGLLKRVNANNFKECVGIRSLKWLAELHLECNKLSSLKMFRGTYWLRSLYLQNNLIEDIGEIMYLSELRKLSILDMTGNPVCGYKYFLQTTLFIIPSLQYLNQMRSSDVETKRKSEVITHKNSFVRAARIVKELLIASELRRENHVPWSCHELDSLSFLYSPYPVLLLVGPEGSGHKELCQCLHEKLPQKTRLTHLLTTRTSGLTLQRYVSTPTSNEKVNSDSKENTEDPTSTFKVYRTVAKEKFVELLFAGSLASVVEDRGFFFGLDKCEALRATREGKVLLAAVDLTTALVLYLTEFCGGPRLVLVLPESPSDHERNLRREFRNNESFTLEEELVQLDLDHKFKVSADSEECRDTPPEGEAGKVFSLKGDSLAEQGFVRRNLEAREECLMTHQNNPGVFHCGIFCDNKEYALERIAAMVEDMQNDWESNCTLKERPRKTLWLEGTFSSNVDDLINRRLEKELSGCVPSWE